MIAYWAQRCHFSLCFSLSLLESAASSPGARAPQVLEAHGLSLWNESSGFEAPAYSLGLPVSYDTFVKLKLTSGEGPARAVHEEARTGTITGSREPVFLRQFEFLAQPAQRTLEVSVVNTAYVGRGRIQDKTIGVTSLRPCDLAQCPGGQVCPLTCWGPSLVLIKGII